MNDLLQLLGVENPSLLQQAVAVVSAAYALWVALVALWTTLKHTFKAGRVVARTTKAAGNATVAWLCKPSRAAVMQAQLNDMQASLQLLAMQPEDVEIAAYHNYK